MRSRLWSSASDEFLEVFYASNADLKSVEKQLRIIHTDKKGLRSSRIKDKITKFSDRSIYY